MNARVRFCALVSLAAIVLQVNSIPLTIALFRLNQTEIARTECEHRQPHCNGHCFLMKQMAKAGTSETDKRASRIEIHLDQNFLSSTENNLVSDCPHHIQPIQDKESDLLQVYSSSLFQPPRIV